MPNPSIEREVEELFSSGRLEEAANILSTALAREETGSLWNDWGVVLLALAERAFRRSLELEPERAGTDANLAVLLFSEGKLAESVPLLKRALKHGEGAQRTHLASLLAQCESSPAPASAHIMDLTEIGKEVRRVLEAYFTRGDRSMSVATPAGFVPILEGRPEGVEEMVRGSAVHDEDYLVFGAFQDPESVILDVGANFGYSAASIWGSGSNAMVVSFEPNPGYAGCLDRIAELRPGRFEYVLVGLADAPGVIEFAMPVINGYGIGALATACTAPNLDDSQRNILDFYKENMTGFPFKSMRMHPFRAEVARLDDLLAQGKITAKSDRVVAVKIDAESYEGRIVAGALEFLSAKKPLVLAESGHCNPQIFEPLLNLGYVRARRHDRKLKAVDDPVASVSGFFIHPACFKKYKQIGLLLD